MSSYQYNNNNGNKKIDDNMHKICSSTSKSSFPGLVMKSVNNKCPLSENEIAFNIFTSSSSTLCSSKLIDNVIFDIKCPNDNNNVNETHQDHTVKYFQRSCLKSTGMWSQPTVQEQKCYFLLGIKYMNITNFIQVPNVRGQVILDWGAGCSNQILWLYQYYGYYGFGVDLVETSKQYGMQHFHNQGNGPLMRYCSGDGRDLSYIPSNTFAHIISIAAVYHLPHDEECKLVLEHFVRILKKNGKIWIGWMGTDESTMAITHWKDCFKDSHHIIEYHFINDVKTLGFSLYGDTKTYSIFITKK